MRNETHERPSRRGVIAAAGIVHGAVPLGRRGRMFARAPEPRFRADQDNHMRLTRGGPRSAERRAATQAGAGRNRMRKLVQIACAAGVLLAASGAQAQDVASPGPGRNSHSQGALDGAKAARLSLSQGIERAERSSGGRAVEATFTPFAAGGGSHDIVILRPDGMLAHYHLDANEGTFVGVTDQKVASLLTSLTPQAVGAVRTSLLQAVSLVEQQAPDQRAIGATAEQDGATVTYEITLATRDGDKTLHVDSNGAVTK